jgi:hypothetical protein
VVEIEVGPEPYSQVDRRRLYQRLNKGRPFHQPSSSMTAKLKAKLAIWSIGKCELNSDVRSGSHSLDELGVKDALVLEVPVSLPCLSALCSATLCLPLSGWDWDFGWNFSLGRRDRSLIGCGICAAPNFEGRTGTLVAYLKFIEQVGNFECFMLGRIGAKRSSAHWSSISRASDCEVSTELDRSQLLVPAEKRKANNRMNGSQEARSAMVFGLLHCQTVVEVVF